MNFLCSFLVSYNDIFWCANKALYLKRGCQYYRMEKYKLILKYASDSNIEMVDKISKKYERECVNSIL